LGPQPGEPNVEGPTDTFNSRAAPFSIGSCAKRRVVKPAVILAASLKESKAENGGMVDLIAVKRGQTHFHL
jgi:hypothetical protein